MSLVRCSALVARRLPTRSFPVGVPTKITRIKQLKELRDQPKPELRFPLHTIPKSDKPSGFLPPLGKTENLPFQFRRTAGSQFPVYSALKNGMTKQVTIVRGYEGNVEELIEEIRRVIADPACEIQQKQSKLVIKGNHVGKLKRWLRALGF